MLYQQELIDKLREQAATQSYVYNYAPFDFLEDFILFDAELEVYDVWWYDSTLEQQVFFYLIVAEYLQQELNDFIADIREEEYDRGYTTGRFLEQVFNGFKNGTMDANEYINKPTT